MGLAAAMLVGKAEARMRTCTRGVCAGQEMTSEGQYRSGGPVEAATQARSQSGSCPGGLEEVL